MIYLLVVFMLDGNVRTELLNGTDAACARQHLVRAKTTLINLGPPDRVNFFPGEGDPRFTWYGASGVRQGEKPKAVKCQFVPKGEVHRVEAVEAHWEVSDGVK